MKLLHRLRTHSRRLARSLVGLLTVAWLMAALQPCAMAASMSAPDADPHAVHRMAGMDHGAMDHMTTGHAPPKPAPEKQPCCCCDGENDPGLPCNAPTCEMQATSHHLVQIVPLADVTLWTFEPAFNAEALPRNTRRPPPVHVADYLPTHPTIRFCTLLI
jgi:hypothetical protein